MTSGWGEEGGAEVINGWRGCRECLVDNEECRGNQWMEVGAEMANGWRGCIVGDQWMKVGADVINEQGWMQRLPACEEKRVQRLPVEGGEHRGDQCMERGGAEVTSGWRGSRCD